MPPAPDETDDAQVPDPAPDEFVLVHGSDDSRAVQG